MSSPLTDALTARRAEISSEVHRRLQCSSAVHYRRIDQDVLCRRAEALVDKFLSSLSCRPAIFIDYIKALAGERIDEGFFLKEIQLALSILEEQAWTMTVEVLPAADQVQSLAIVSGVIGAAKDQLALVYLDHLRHARSRVEDLERHCEVLSCGTDSGPVEPLACLGAD